MSGACTGSSWSLKEGGGFMVVVPAFPAVITYGATREEALENARDAIRLYLGIPPQGQRSSRTAGRHPGRGSRYH